MVILSRIFFFGAFNMVDLCHDSNCVYCGQPAFIRALIVNKYGTISNEFVCPKCIKDYDIELGFQTHSGD